MGANAQTSVPTFTAGDVLTAANMNISAGTGVPVFADTTARDAAFGGTGEKTLAEGQLCYVENLTGVAQIQYYDGSNWISLTSGGLQLITAASFTTATSVSLPNSTFTSTYRNYRMIFVINALTADVDLTCRLRASGTDNTSALYGTMLNGISATGTSMNSTANGGTSWNFGEADSGNPFWQMSVDILSPELTERTNLIGGLVAVDKAATAGAFHRTGAWNYNATTQFDSLSVISSVASSISGVYRIYGYSDS